MNPSDLADRLIDAAQRAGADDGWLATMGIAHFAGEDSYAIVDAVSCMWLLGADIPSDLMPDLVAYAATLPPADRSLLRLPVSA